MDREAEHNSKVCTDYTAHMMLCSVVELVRDAKDRKQYESPEFLKVCEAIDVVMASIRYRLHGDES